MLQAWKDTLKEAWYFTNWLAINTIRFFCGQSLPYEEFKNHYRKGHK